MPGSLASKKQRSDSATVAATEYALEYSSSFADVVGGSASPPPTGTSNALADLRAKAARGMPLAYALVHCWMVLALTGGVVDDTGAVVDG
jgi:hypothetical protein